MQKGLSKVCTNIFKTKREEAKIINQKSNIDIDLESVKELAAHFKLPIKFVELLFLRGLNNAEKIDDFLCKTDSSCFFDPFLLKGMDEAAARINLAIKNGERVVVYGDYDADGVCSSAILHLFLTGHGLKVYTHIPSRDGEGYGLSISVLEKIIDDFNPDLIITCDCGISCINEVEFILDIGVDIIITDHHQPQSQIPNCTVVNPHQPDCTYPFKELCGAGVVLKLVHATAGLSVAEGYLPLAAIATVADLVPLKSENRAIVRLGLQKLNSSIDSVGVSKLLKSLKLTTLVSTDIAFKIAPRLNAAGRMGDAKRAFDLLTTADPSQADQIITQLELDNDKRKLACEKMYNEAVFQLKQEKLYQSKSIILFNPLWEKGITGIVAAKLCGEFNRPVIIMAKSDDGYKGTCRSLDGINLHEALTKYRELLFDFGGHSQAAGFSINQENLTKFKEKLQDHFNQFPDNLFMPKVDYDMQICPSDIDLEFVNCLQLLEPFGHSNKMPLFCINATDLVTEPLKNDTHAIIRLPDEDLRIVAFGHSSKDSRFLGSAEKKLVIELKNDTYHKIGFCGHLKSVKTKQLFIDDDLTKGQFLKYFNHKNTPFPKQKTYNLDQMEQLTDGQMYGNLFVAGSQKAYNDFLAKHFDLATQYDVFNAAIKNNYNRLIISPDFDDNLMLDLYSKIIF
ncbi:MAG: single-stranded-DNA-specific exonuclease RecJ, partial [Firmicutes bacterium]|nr:single-stranded-DNA-specific exonuclease RecJ [Bacillota bacterium]